MNIEETSNISFELDENQWIFLNLLIVWGRINLCDDRTLKVLGIDFLKK